MLTSADLLRLSFAGTVAVGGALELKKIAAERATLLAEERARVRALNELSAMKADFTSMVAHELASSLLAVRSIAEVLAGEDLRPEERASMLARLHEQADGLGILVEDVRASAAAERDGFAIEPRQVPVVVLLSGGRFLRRGPDRRSQAFRRRRDGRHACARRSRAGRAGAPQPHL